MYLNKFFENINTWNDYIEAQKLLNNKEKGKISVPSGHKIKYGNYTMDIASFTMRVKRRYKIVNSNGFKKSNVKTLFDDKNDPRIKLFEELKGWNWSNKIKFPDYKTAKTIVLKMKIKTLDEYKKRIRLSNPHNLPSKPKRVYKEFTNNKDFFGETYSSRNFKKTD